ncbi:MAG: hypothetical protein L3J92_05060 [Thermoplasmata archaeon]|nr:hypothetical protein [Thermoplasmata archaeon]
MTALSDLLATAVGATISGLAGVVIVLFQSWRKDIRKFEGRVLAPAYTYVAGLPDDCPWLNLSPPPWEALDAYATQKIPPEFRSAFKELSARLDAYSATYTRWYEFLTSDKGGPGFETSVRGVLPYLSEDKQSVVLKPDTSDAKVVHSLITITNGLVPYVLSNLSNPERAWGLLDAGWEWVYPSVKVVRVLREVDPAVLPKMFDAIIQSAEAPKATKLVESMRDSYARVAEENWGQQASTCL